MKLGEPQLPVATELSVTWLDRFRFQVSQILRTHASQLNGVTEGRNKAFHNGATAAPTTGTWAQGDFIRNSEPAELGSAGSKYLIHGWQCVSGGTPGTWKNCHFLTGN